LLPSRVPCRAHPGRYGALSPRTSAQRLCRQHVAVNEKLVVVLRTFKNKPTWTGVEPRSLTAMCLEPPGCRE
jgi:hypothetical protein